LIGNYPSALNLTLNGATNFEPYGPLKNGNPAIAIPDISSGTIPVPGAYAARALAQDVFARLHSSRSTSQFQKQLPWAITAQAGYVASRQSTLPRS